MKYNEDLRQHFALLVSTPEFIRDVEEFRRKNTPYYKTLSEVGRLMKKYHLPIQSHHTLLHYLNYNEVLIPTGYGFMYERDPITGEWIEYIKFDPDFPTRYAQQAFTELNKGRLLPKKGKKRKSTYFQSNLTIYQLDRQNLSAEEIENELKKLGNKSSVDQWSIRQVVYRQRKRLKHNA